ncbi:hypothetical protein PMAC_000027 [Pneumocystis sp. 'macacae']|nr:hypothetical protein PMAC_000027 [Pneumocystis sp. 'macacae']
MQLQPGWSGIFVTCARKHEHRAAKEIIYLFNELTNIQYLEKHTENDALNNFLTDPNPIDNIKKSACWEERVAQEIAELQKKHYSKLQVIDIKTPCVVFIRTKWPLDPVEIVRDLCEKILLNQIKRIRWSQRLTPVTLTACATLPDLQKLAQKVLQLYFDKNGPEALKEIISNRQKQNINTLCKMTREDIIKIIAPIASARHKVDLKNYDFLIMVEVFKGICGISVVHDFERFKKLNIASIMESTTKKYKRIS